MKLFDWVFTMSHAVTAFFLFLALGIRLHAADITVVGKSDQAAKQSVSLAALRTDNTAAAREFMTVLTSDLSRSGWFMPVTGTDAAVTLSGNVQTSGTDIRVQATCSWLMGQRQATWSLSVPHDKIRDAAHALCDFVVEKVTGKPGMASSKILMVGRRGNVTEIYICDADGARLQQLTSDAALCLSPNWMYHRNAFLYTAWLSGMQAIYEVDLDTQRRHMLSSFPGMNHGAVTHPNGDVMALILSRSGGVDLYVQNLATRALTRITASKSVNEASPAWSPDGKNLVYVSDEGRIPRIYAMDVARKQPRRLVYAPDIRESVAPEWGTSNLITFCGRSGGRYKIYVIDPRDDPRITAPKQVSPEDGAHYEDPSWAPNGRHIVCTRTVNFKRSLVILDTMGDPMQPLNFNVPGDWYLPNWSRTNNPIR